MEIRLRKWGFLLLAGLLIGLAAAACGSDSDTSADSNSTATAVPTAAPTSTPPRLAFLTPGAVSPTSAPTAAPTSVAGPSSGTTDPMGDDLFALGEKVFTVGSGKQDQIGCQYCHAADGKGNIGPNIRGKMAGDVEFALDNVESMIFLKLNHTEIEAIAEYLQWLATQP